jgi:hypothetical protein
MILAILLLFLFVVLVPTLLAIECKWHVPIIYMICLFEFGYKMHGINLT